MFFSNDVISIAAEYNQLFGPSIKRHKRAVRRHKNLHLGKKLGKSRQNFCLHGRMEVLLDFVNEQDSFDMSFLIKAPGP